jgi:hypothetical protein
MQIRYTEDIYGPSGELLYEEGTEILGYASDGGFADYTYNIQVGPCSYEVIDPEDHLITLKCDSGVNDFLVAEVDDSGDTSAPNDTCIVLTIYGGPQMLGGVTFYEKAKVRELIQFLQDAIAE